MYGRALYDWCPISPPGVAVVVGYGSFMVSVLFVCLGNICRSPMADAVMRNLIDDAGLSDQIRVDSAGTGDWHVGEPPHAGTRTELSRRGVDEGDMRARQVTGDDLHEFDYVIAMDAQNLDDLLQLAARLDTRPHARLSLLLEHAGAVDDLDVPDPYFVGGFDAVFDLVHAGCEGLLRHICAHEGLGS